MCDVRKGRANPRIIWHCQVAGDNQQQFPDEAPSNGLGVGIQNIGDNEISCDLDFLNDDGTPAGQEVILLDPLGSFVDFFNDSVADGFKGIGTLTCDAPVVAVAVNQDSANGSFPTDRITIKGVN